jgi:hypothetical protein
MAAVFKPDRLQHRFRLAFNIRRLLLPISSGIATFSSA